MGRVEINPHFREEYANEFGPQWQREAGDAGAAAITAAMPFQTGNMRFLTEHTPIVDADMNPAIRFKGRAEYTIFVDQGTGIHGPLNKWITPQTAKALSWVGSNGKRVTASRVRGQRGQRFFNRGLSAVFHRVVEYRYGDGRTG